MSETAADWVRIEDAAGYLERSKRRIYEYLHDAENAGKGIRNMRVGGVLFINLPDLVEYEAHVPTPGRPRKDRPTHD
jgi:hypothetical protein